MSADPAIDLFSRCFGCGYEFQPGDRRLRFKQDEWSEHMGLEPLGIDIDIGLCDRCTQGGDFKEPEIVSASSRGRA